MVGCASSDQFEEDLGETQESILMGQDGDILVEGEVTVYGQGSVSCPSDMLALGGGSRCTFGGADWAYPITSTLSEYDLPVATGYREWHRGDSSNDCEVYAVCAPKIWFGRTDIKAVQKGTGYGQGDVSCGAGYKAVGGGSVCTNGGVDFNYPDSSLSGWKEWHRGESSNDCRVHAVCVKDSHWFGRGVYRTESFTQYGQGSTLCGEGTVLGGGSWCSAGEMQDWTYPMSDLSGWSEWHRGGSSNDCRVSAVCLKDSVYKLNEVGAPCGVGRIRDCDRKCVDRKAAYKRKKDATCDNGSTGFDLFCEAFDWDSGECI